MFPRLCFLSFSIALFAACAPLPVEGGSNDNDRSHGGEQGETLLTGAMTVSPDGKFALMQRNQTSVLLDIAQMSPREMPQQVERFVFAKGGGFAIAVLPSGAGMIALDLATGRERWRLPSPGNVALGMARLSDDDANLVIGGGDSVYVVDAVRGDVRGEVKLGSRAQEFTFVPASSRALVVASTQWALHKPQTKVFDVDLADLSTRSTDVPNCAAPAVILPDASRAFLSPTFCEEGKASTSSQQWTNPDPVSVIDLGASGPVFLKNLLGFGPVALDDQGHRAVAYLDVQRMDATMFDDASSVPAVDGPRYHIMIIDPHTLAYTLSPVGDLLPRFALAKDQTTVLVDATAPQVRGKAKIKANLDSSGQLSVDVRVFGKKDALFGVFDLETRAFTGVSGALASLDRFVQMADRTRVFTLKLTADGQGGDLYRIDLAEKSATALGQSLRDIGLLAEGETMLLRKRLPAAQVTSGAGIDWYRREQYCLSADGITCSSSVDFQDSKPFQSGPACKDYHDC